MLQSLHIALRVSQKQRKSSSEFSEKVKRERDRAKVSQVFLGVKEGQLLKFLFFLYDKR